MARHKSYETAAARRRHDPIILTIDGVDVQLVETVDLADLAPVVEELQAVDSGTSKLSNAAEQMVRLREVIGMFVAPEGQEAFESVKKSLDPALMGTMLKDLIEEYMGAPNPTQPKSSSAPLSASGTPSTDGAEQGE